MFTDVDAPDVFGLTSALDSLRELEQNSHEAFLRQRAHERLDIQLPVVVRPANASDRHRMSVAGLTGDVSAGGCRVLVPRAVLPGDLFWLSFEPGIVTLGSLYARCMRCRMIDDEAFEVGFRFFQELDLAGALS